jgi:hypothetical protein
MSAVPISTEEHRPFDLTATLPSIETMRDAVATMALCGEEFDQVQQMIETTRASCTGAIEEEFQHRTFALKGEHTRADEELHTIEQAIEDARKNRILLADLQQKKRALEREVAVTEQEVRKKKVAAEREEFRRLLDQSDNRVQSAQHRLTEEQKAAAEKQHEVWQKQLEEIDRRVGILQEHLAEIDVRLAQARARAAPLVERNITRTVAGFLLWVGYGSFAAIGSTIALLLPALRDDKAPLAQILAAVRVTIAGFPKAWGIGRVFVASLLVFVVGVVLFAGFVVAMDWVLRRFDHGWRRESMRRRPKRGSDRAPGNQALDAQLSATIPEVRRSSYVQLLAALPYVVITGALTCLLAASAHPAFVHTTKTNAIPASIVATYIGTVLALLMTASFVMYILEVLDRRAKEIAAQTVVRPSWKTGWEFMVIPFVLVGALLYTMFQTDRVQAVWGAIAIFMLLSCLAVAYGVVYRGIFYDIIRLERDRDRILKAIAEARSVTEPEPADTDGIVEARNAVNAAREQRDHIDALQYPGLYVERRDSGAWYRRFLSVGPAKPPVVPFDLRLVDLTDAEAAPEESRRLIELSSEISENEREMVRATSSLDLADLPKLGDRKRELETGRAKIVASRDALEFQRHRALWELNGQIESLMIDLRAAFDIAKTVEPAVSRIAAEARKS